MRKLIITILFMSAGFITFAQKIPANIIKKATAASEYIATELNFDENQKKDIFTILSEKYDSNRKKIRGKDLSDEEKRKIYKASFIETKNNRNSLLSN